MLLSIKLKQLLIMLGFTSIFAEITGIKLKSMKSARKKKKNTDKNDKELEGICQSLMGFYQQQLFKEKANQFFETKKGKGLKTRVNAGKERQLKNQPRIHNCLDSKDYNAFLTYYLKIKNEEPIKLKCDLLKPKLLNVQDILCNSIGKYFIQFGIKVYYKFFKYLLNIGKKKKRSFFSKIFTYFLKRLVNKYETIKEPNKKNKEFKKIQKWIDNYYKLDCRKIIPHYNAFNIFYDDYSKSKKYNGFDKNRTCDYFVRITTVDTKN